MSDMIFTPVEMASLYRQAKDKKGQVEIFATTNCIPAAEVIEILKQQGIKQQELPRVRGGSQAAPKQKTQPDPAAERISNRIRLLLSRKAQLESEKARVAEALKAVTDKLELIEKTLFEEDGDNE